MSHYYNVDTLKVQSGIRGLFHPEMGCAKASVRCPRCALGAQKLPRCATRCASGAQKLPRCATRCTPGAQKNPRGAKIYQGHKNCPGAQQIPRDTNRNHKKAHGHPKRTSGVQKNHRSTSGAHTCRNIFYVTSYGCLNTSDRNHFVNLKF